MTDAEKVYRAAAEAFFCNRVRMSDEQATKAVQHYRERYAEEGMLEADIYPGMEKLLQNLGDAGVTRRCFRKDGNDCAQDACAFQADRLFRCDLRCAAGYQHQGQGSDRKRSRIADNSSTADCLLVGRQRL